MDLQYSQEYEEFRTEVAAFLSRCWQAPEKGRPSADSIKRFRNVAIEAGYLYRSVPKVYGGSESDPDVLKAQIIRDEFERVRAPREIASVGVDMLVPTLLEKGEDWQKEKFIRRTIEGDCVWCQGYSEPGSGSDLASVSTKAVLDGDGWRINGQKIWTSYAHKADYMFILVRTEPDKPKHEGISYLLLDMHQPGVEVRPLKQITGGSTFNEVFFDDAITPADWIVGERGQGWAVSRTTLKHERNWIGGAGKSVALFDKLVELAGRSKRFGRPALEDPEICDRLAQLEGLILAHKFSGHRQLTAGAKGVEPGLIGLMNKLMTTKINHDVANIVIELLGEAAMQAPMGGAGERASGDSKWLNQYYGSLGFSIAGGTSNIQRNIIAERGLGLPRE